MFELMILELCVSVMKFMLDEQDFVLEFWIWCLFNYLDNVLFCFFDEVECSIMQQFVICFVSKFLIYDVGGLVLFDEVFL